jgi:hypothetical protein
MLPVRGRAVPQLVEALRHNTGSSGIDSLDLFLLSAFIKPGGHSISNINESQGIFLGAHAAGAYSWQLCHNNNNNNNNQLNAHLFETIL